MLVAFAATSTALLSRLLSALGLALRSRGSDEGRAVACGAASTAPGANCATEGRRTLERRQPCPIPKQPGSHPVHSR